MEEPKQRMLTYCAPMSKWANLEKEGKEIEKVRVDQRNGLEMKERNWRY